MGGLHNYCVPHGTEHACCGYSWARDDEASGNDCGKDLKCAPLARALVICMTPSIRVIRRRIGR